MIRYKRGSLFSHDIIFRLYGSAVPGGVARGLVAGFVCFCMIYWGVVGELSGGGLMYHPNPFTFFFTIAAMILAFHTSQAYNRFWEARTNVTNFFTYWSDCVAHILAFERSKDSYLNACIPDMLPPAVDLPMKTPTSPEINKDLSVKQYNSEWRSRIVHLFSLLHGLSVWHLQNPLTDIPPCSEILGGISVSEYQFLGKVEDKCYLASYWCLEEISRRHVSGGLPVPAPVMSRTYQIFNLGTISLAQARKIQDTPFPFPYIQLIHFIDVTILLCLPVVMACWVPSIPLAASLAAFVVGAFHSLFTAAGMMESPFGLRANDLPLVQIQRDFNKRLISFLDIDIAAYLHTNDEERMDDSVTEESFKSDELHKSRSVISVISAAISAVGPGPAKREVPTPNNSTTNNATSINPTTPQNACSDQSSPMGDANTIPSGNSRCYSYGSLSGKTSSDPRVLRAVPSFLKEFPIDN